MTTGALADPRDRYSSWVEVDLDALHNNVRWLAAHTSTQLMVIVKANGYGHGADSVARTVLRAGASWCGVARIDEALTLRRAGVECPILILGFTPPGRLEEGIVEGLSFTVWTAEQAHAAEQAARRAGKEAKIHLKVDTGMGRIGAQPADVLDLARLIFTTPELCFEGVFSHFAKADDEDPTLTDAQLTLFNEVVQALAENGLRPPLVHVANSVSALTRTDVHFDLVRAGITVYGLQPASWLVLPHQLKPTLTWNSQLSHVKRVAPGAGLSYGHLYKTTDWELIGTLPVGYADGLRRNAPNEVLVKGIRCPVVGRVCMDQCLVQLDKVPDAKPGDRVVLLGAAGQERIAAEEIADRWNSINYDVVTSIGARVPRLYTGQGS